METVNQFLCLAACNRGFEGSSCRNKDSVHSTVQNIAKSWVTCFRKGYQEKICYNHNTMLHWLPFIDLVWTTCRTIPVFTLDRFSMRMSSSIWTCDHWQHSYLGKRREKRDSATWVGQQKTNRPVCFALHGEVAPYFLNNEQSGKVSISGS